MARRSLHLLRRGLADLLLAVRCCGCGRPGFLWCDGCDQMLRGCPLQRTVGGSSGPAIPAISVTRYEGVVRAAILAHKEQGRWGLAHPLGRSLAPSVLSITKQVGRGRDCIVVPMPSTRSRVRARGYDHGLALARVVARETSGRGEPTIAVPLLSLSHSQPQVGLAANQRRTNRRNVMTAPSSDQLRSWPGRTCIVVVDDVITTGASAEEAIRALRASGLSVSAVATVAAVPASRTP